MDMECETSIISNGRSCWSFCSLFFHFHFNRIYNFLVSVSKFHTVINVIVICRKAFKYLLPVLYTVVALKTFLYYNIILILFKAMINLLLFISLVFRWDIMHTKTLIHNPFTLIVSCSTYLTYKQSHLMTLELI